MDNNSNSPPTLLKNQITKKVLFIAHFSNSKSFDTENLMHGCVKKYRIFCSRIFWRVYSILG